MSGHESSTETKDYTATVLEANDKWAKRLNQVFPQYFPDPKERQAPKILWIGCSDSRVQESDATMALPGTVFTHRNIANQFHLNDDSALSVFAYAVKELGVQHIAVVGHEHCGGVITAMKEATRPPHEDQLDHHHTLYDSLYHFVASRVSQHDIHDKDSDNPNDALTRWLTPLVNHLKVMPLLPADEEEALKIAVEENVSIQVENITKLDQWVRHNAREDRKPVWVHGWVYDFSTGFIRDLKLTKELGSHQA